MDILNRCNTLSVESQLQSKRLRWLGHVFRMPHNTLPKKLLFGVRGFAHLVALGLVSMMLCCMIVKPVELVGRVETRKTDCFGRTGLVLHLPSSS